MSFTKAVATCFRKYFTFSGRATRLEFWFFQIFLCIGGVLLWWIEAIATRSSPLILWLVFAVATLLPSYAAAWRRLHDIGRTGWWSLNTVVAWGVFPFLDILRLTDIHSLSGVAAQIAFAIIVAINLMVFIWLLSPSQPGGNKYGPEPKSETSSQNIDQQA
ncbi:MAG: DUF805 domain-containing protein [Rhodobacteraceae bacterium]|nr:DUF805 domain-containing protein [Paracoccaceae bacterium]